jgi:SpoVK/Ycf46/Vps4 family AAA+-type ATPase
MVLKALLFNGRGGTSSNSTTVGERLLSTLLTEMDGLEQSKVGASHMIEFIIYLETIVVRSYR